MYSVDKNYNKQFELIIDPGILYSTLLGGSSADYAYGIILGELASGASAAIKINIIPQEEGIIENAAAVLGNVGDSNTTNI